MAHVPQIANDIFISYSHLDNQVPPGRSRSGWVDSLVDTLTVQLRRRLGSNALSIWFDRELAGNRPLTPEILNAVKDAALLVVVMSPGYVQSEWCARERNAFLQIAKERLATGRIFLLRCLDVPLGERPAEFGDLLGYSFIDESDKGAPRSLGDPDPDEPAFLKQIYKLSYQLANELNRFADRSRTNPIAGAATPDGSRVFVARATDDLEDREDELRNYLTQAGLIVPPRRQYMQADAASFEAAVRADLDSSKLFVQLVSSARGPEMPFGGTKRLPLLQWEVAQKAAKKIVAWRDRSIDTSTVSNAGHRQLLESAIACPIEEFKRTVTDEVRRETAPVLPRSAGVMVFVDSELRDQPLARQVAAALANQGVSCYWPLDKGTPEEVRKDLEANLRDCHGVVVLYGASEPYWVREQIRFGMKVFSQRTNRPALAICQGPPPEKSELGLLDPNILFLDCSAGFNTEALRPFVASLHA